MKTAYEMTTDEYIEAIGGRNHDADSSVIFNENCWWLSHVKIANFGDYVIAKDKYGDVYAFVAEDIASDIDEAKAVGYFKISKGQTSLAVSGDHHGKGLGLELTWYARKDNPLLPSGGLSSGGYAVNVRFHQRLLASAV